MIFFGLRDAYERIVGTSELERASLGKNAYLTSIVVDSVVEPLELVQWRRAVPHVTRKIGG